MPVRLVWVVMPSHEGLLLMLTKLDCVIRVYATDGSTRAVRPTSGTLALFRAYSALAKSSTVMLLFVPPATQRCAAPLIVFRLPAACWPCRRIIFASTWAAIARD